MTETLGKEPEAGWGRPVGGKVYHYFERGCPLCRVHIPASRFIGYTTTPPPASRCCRMCLKIWLGK